MHTGFFKDDPSEALQQTEWGGQQVEPDVSAHHAGPPVRPGSQCVLAIMDNESKMPYAPEAAPVQHQSPKVAAQHVAQGQQLDLPVGLHFAEQTQKLARSAGVAEHCIFDYIPSPSAVHERSCPHAQPAAANAPNIHPAGTSHCCIHIHVDANHDIKFANCAGDHDDIEEVPEVPDALGDPPPLQGSRALSKPRLPRVKPLALSSALESTLDDPGSSDASRCYIIE